MASTGGNQHCMYPAKTTAHINLHLSVKPIVEKQVVCHSNPVRLHGMALAIVVISNISYRGGRPISYTHTQITRLIY